MDGVADLTAYGAAVAKSVSDEPWSGRPAPRVAPAGIGMLNGIGIQNPGIDHGAPRSVAAGESCRYRFGVRRSGTTVEDFARVAEGLAAAGVRRSRSTSPVPISTAT